MAHSKILPVLFSLPLTVTLGGCLTDLTTPQQSQKGYSQSLTRAQIQQIQMNQQMKVKQKVVQNNTRSKTVYINNAQQQSPVTSGVSYYKNPVPVVVQPPVQQQPEAVLYRRQGELSAKTRETLEIEQARQRSLETYAAEDMARRDAAKEEARQIEQAKQNSLATYAQDQARRSQERAAEAQQTEKLVQQNLAAAQEARQIELATQESLRTHAEEEARRQQQVSSSSNPHPQPALPPENPPVAPISVPAPAWVPSEGQLVQAGDLVMSLKNSHGGKIPSHGDMSGHLQSSMGVSSQQAETILGELGI